jgi:hypothetical protein
VGSGSGFLYLLKSIYGAPSRDVSEAAIIPAMVQDLATCSQNHFFPLRQPIGTANPLVRPPKSIKIYALGCCYLKIVERT